MSINGSPVMALIPARGGSKGVKRKNLREIGGRPLIEYTIQAANEASSIDKVFVSSDDEDILDCARRFEVHAMVRPPEFASDTASAVDVVMHFLSVIPQQDREQNPYIVYLQPTSPLRTGKHIDLAIEEMRDRKINSLISVSELKTSPFKSFVVNENGMLNSLFDERLSNARRQDLPPAYIPNGAIYIFRMSDFIERGGFPSNGSLPFIMSEDESIDVDTEEDIRQLECILGGK